MKASNGRLLKNLALAILLILAVTPLVNASWWPLNLFLESLKQLLMWFVDFLVILINQVMRIFFDLMQDSLLAYPSMYPLKDAGGNLTPNGNILSRFMLILVPLYVFSVLVTGAYMVFMSNSPSGRAQAKMIFDKLLVSMIVVPLSPAIYELLLKTNDVITRAIISVITSGITNNATIGDAFYSTMANAPTGAKIAYLLVWWFVLLSSFLALLTMWFRYLCVLALGLVFPFTLFLYLHDWTKQLGTQLLRFTLVWIYAPVIQAVWLAIGVATVATAGQRGFISDAATPFFLIASLMMVFASPLVMSGVMRWLGGIISAVGMLMPGPYGIALAAAGGIMQGKGVGAITSVGLKIGVSKMWGKASSLMKKAKGGSSTSSLGGQAHEAMKGPDPGKNLGADGGPSSSALPKGGGAAPGAGGKTPAAGLGGGGAGKTAGKAGAAAGKGIEAGSKATGEAIDKGGSAAGDSLMKAGQAQMSGATATYGITAVTGAATMAAGAAVKAGGKAAGAAVKAGGKAAGKAVEYGGKAAGKVADSAVGKAAKRAAGSSVGKATGRATRALGRGAWAGAKTLANPMSLKRGGALAAVSDAYTAARGKSMGADLKSAGKSIGAGIKSAYGNTIGNTRLGQTLASGAQKLSRGAQATKRFANRMRQAAGRGMERTKDAAWHARHPIQHAKGERRDAGGASKLSGGEAPGTKPAGGGEDENLSPQQQAQKKKAKELDLKQELSSPDHRPQDPFKGTGEILDGMDTEE